MHVLLGTGVGLLALVPRHEIDAAVHRRQLLTLGAASLAMVALALVILLLLPGGRSALRGLAGRRGQRSPLALFGEVVAAAHDPHALLPCDPGDDRRGDRAPKAALLIWDGETVAELGSGSAARPSGSCSRSTTRWPTGCSCSTRRGSASRLPSASSPRSLAGHGRIALDNARLHGVVRRQAVTDDLTDLANRRRFMDALRQEVARSARLETPLALVLFDLDHFKRINDRCGHQAGDDVLRSAADVIRATRARDRSRGADRRRGVRGHPAGHRRSPAPSRSPRTCGATSPWASSCRTTS